MIYNFGMCWVVPLKYKKGITVSKAFQKDLDESKRREAKSYGRKLNKIWADKGSRFYNRSMKSWIEKNDLEMYSTHNEGKFVIAERFVRTLKNKICKYMNSISKNLYIDKLDDKVNKYNNTYHNTIKINPVDVKLSIYIDYCKEIND